MTRTGPRRAAVTMRSLRIAALPLVLTLALCTGAAAQGMSPGEYRAARKTVESDFTTARTGCEPMLANVKDLCFADVRGREAVALAELQAEYQPSARASHDVRLAKAEAAFALARERCDDQPSAKQRSCILDAGTARAAARSDSEARLANPGTVVEAPRYPGERPRDRWGR